MKRENKDVVRENVFRRVNGMFALTVLLVAVLFVFAPKVTLADDSHYMTWDTGSGIWDASSASTSWNGGGRKSFQDYDYVYFKQLPGVTTTSVITVNSNVIVSGMQITGGNYTFNGTGKISGAIAGSTGEIVKPTGHFLIANSGNTVTLNIETDFIYGNSLSSGYLIIGHEKALGTFAVNNTNLNELKGQLVMGGSDAYVSFAGNYNLNNRFVMNNGTITIVGGQTITVSDVDNTSTDNGGAFYMSYDAAIAGTGNLIINNNQALKNGGGIYGINTSFVTLSSLQITNNTSVEGSGGGIYGISGIVLGKNVTFSGNKATAGSGGAIYSTGNVNVAGNTLFSGNIAGVAGGAIYMAGTANGTSLALNTSAGHIVFDGNKAGSNANSLYLDKNVTVNISGGYNVYFNDPLTSGSVGGNSLNKTGDGFVQFKGNNVLNAAGGDGGLVNVTGGVFRVVSGASFNDNGTGGSFTLGKGATLAGGGSLKSESFIISGILSPDADTFAAPSGVGSGSVGNANSTVTTGKEIATLTINGNATLNGAQLNVNLGATSDLIRINGEVAFGANQNAVNIIDSSVTTGSYKIMEVLGSANYTINLDNFDGKVKLNDAYFTPRYGTATLVIKSGSGKTNNELWLDITKTTGTLRLEWGGDVLQNSNSYGVWSDENASNLNWVNSQYRMDFQQKDYAYFADTFTDENGQTQKANKLVSVESNGVDTAGMHVASGDYTFTGGAIRGDNNGAGGAYNTGRLLIDGSASANFYNTVAFTQGMVVNGTAKVTLSGSGKFDDAMNIALATGTTLTYNTGKDYEQVGVISGAGTVVKAGNYALTLSGAHTGTGQFLHNAGILNLNGSWAGDYVQAGTSGALNVKNGAGATIGKTATFGGVVDMQNSTVGTVLNVGSTVNLNGATLKIDIGANNTSDKIVAGGTLGDANNRNLKGVDINAWSEGKYNILSTTNMYSWQPDNYTITINGKSLSQRQYAELKVEGNNLYLTTSLANVQLVWASNSDNWTVAETDIKWNDNGSVSPATTYFRDKDYVIFKHTDTTNRTVTISGDRTVSGMDIESGNYTFTGGSLTGTTNGVIIRNDATWTASDKLNVKGGSATFNNTQLNFAGGMVIYDKATVNLGAGSNVTNTAIANSGILNFTSTGTYDHSGTLTGGGVFNKTNAGTLNLGGTYTGVTGTFNQSSGLVNLSTIWGGNYNQTRGTFNSSGATGKISGDASFSGTVNLNGTSVGALNVKTLTLNNATLNINATGTTNDKIASTGAVTVTGTGNTINLSLDNWTGGTKITIITGTSVSNYATIADYFNPVVITGGSARQGAEIKGDNNSIWIEISGSKALNLTWNGGDTTNIWNTVTSNTNWKDSLNADQYFANGDTVTFANTVNGVTVNKNVNVVGTGVTANGINITGSGFNFTGGTINATTATVASGASATFGNVVVISGTNSLVNSGTVNLAAGSNVNKIDNRGTLNFTATGAYTHDGVITGAGAVNKITAGTLALSGTYTGVTGTFTQNHADSVVNLSKTWGGNYSQTSGTFNSSAADVTIAKEANFGGTVNINGGNVGTLNVGTLKLNGATINMTLGVSSNDLIASTGALTASGTSTINLTANGWTFAVGEHILLTAASGVNGANFALGNTPALSGRQALSLITVNGTTLKLNAYMASGSMKWNGKTDGNWNYTTKNWTGITEDFQEGDYAIFDNSAARTGTVTVQTGGVITSGMEINSGTYTFTGAAISGNGTFVGANAAQYNTNKLDIKGDANVTFGNALNFSKGMNIAATATVNLAANSDMTNTAITNLGTLNFTTATKHEGTLLGSGDFNKSTTGTLTLDGTYTNVTGTFNQSAGEVVLNYNWGGDYNQTGGTFTTKAGNIAINGANTQLGSATATAGNVNLGGTGVGTLNVKNITLNNAVLNITVSGTTNDKIVASGNVAFGSDLNSIKITGWDSSVSEIIIIQGGTVADINGKFSSIIEIVGGGVRDKAVLHGDGSKVWITFTSGAALNLVWNGAVGSNTWNTVDTNKNWLDSDSDPQFFTNGDYVTFNKDAAEKNVIVAAGGVTVSGISIEDTTYTFTGAAINGSNATAEIKSGAGAIFKNEGVNLGKLVINTGASATLDNSEKTAASFGATAITNQGSLTFIIDDATSSTHAGVITSDGHNGTGSSVIKDGAGTLVLDGTYANYKGALNQQAGTVELKKDWGGSYIQTAGTELIVTGNRTISSSASLAGITTFSGSTQTLTTGELTLNGATLNITVATGNVSSSLVSTGNVAINGANTINISQWQAGTYKIIIADGDLNYTGNINNLFTANIAGGLTGRQDAVFGTIVENNKNIVTITLSDGKSFDLVWNGTDAAHSWNEVKTNQNWLNGSSDEAFMNLDYAKFTNAAQNKQVEIVDGNGVAKDVTVAGMLVEGGEYTFSGGAISGVKPTANGQTSTGKLEILNNSTKATFENSISFAEGMEIGSGATAVLKNDGVNANGAFADSMTVTNSGTLEFNVDGSASYTQSGALKGNGAVVKSGDGSLVLSGTGSTANGEFMHNAGNVTLNYGWAGNYTHADGTLNTVAGKAIAGDYVQSANTAVLNAADGSLFAKDATLTGSVNIAGNGVGSITVGTQGQNHSLTLNGATLNITTDAGSTAADKIVVVGAVYATGANTINAGDWAKGLYTILEAGSGISDAMLSQFTLNVNNLSNRKQASLKVDGQKLQIAMTVRNLNIDWKGGNGKWSDINWEHNAANESFEDGDAVNFITGTGLINVDSDVTVADMNVNGTYTFTGGKITGDAANSENLTGDSKLTVIGSATFENEIYFKGGMVVTGTAVLHKGASGSGINGDFGNTAIANSGTLEFNVDQNANYTQIGDITGNGNVVKSGDGLLVMDVTGAGSFAQNQGDVTLNYGWGGNYTQAAGILAANGDINGNYTQNGGVLNAKNGIKVDGNAVFKGETIIAGTATGVITITGGASFSDAQYTVSLSGASTSDQLVITGAVNADATNKTVINIDNWSTGTYEIILAGSGLANTNGFADEVLLNGQALTGRKTASLSVKNNTLILTTGGSNLNLTWTGDAQSKGNEWGGVDIWHDATANGDETFMSADYVVFTDQYAGSVNINGSVAVAGMEITGGTYVFGGDAISTVDQTKVSGNLVTATEKLKVSGSNTDATFNNQVTFAKGADVTEGKVTFANTADLGTGTNAGLNIGTDGTVVLAKDGVNTNGAFVNTAISNAGNLSYAIGTGMSYEQDGGLTNTGLVSMDGEGTLTLKGTINGAGAFAQNDGTVVLATNWGGNYVQNKGTLTTEGNNITIGKADGSGSSSFNGVLNPNGADEFGTLTIKGDAKFDGVEYIVTLGTGNKSDMVAITGDVTFGSGNFSGITIGSWEVGTYEIMTANSGLNNVGANTPIYVNGVDITQNSGRMSATLDNSNDKKLVITTVASNMGLYWRNTDQTWAYTNQNDWDDSYDGTGGKESFIAGDYAWFTNAGGGTVTVQNGGVQTSGMHIEAGSRYTFTGGKITGLDSAAGFGGATGKLEVKATDAIATNVTFETGVDFNQGMSIDKNATVVMSNDGSAKQGAFADAMTIANSGTLEFNVDGAGDYTQKGLIDGNGNIVKSGSGKLAMDFDIANASSVGAFAHNAGDVTLNYGWGADYTMGSGAGTLTVANGKNIDGDLIQQGGTVVAGNNMVITGNYLQSAGAVLNAPDCSLTINGSASFKGDIYLGNGDIVVGGNLDIHDATLHVNVIGKTSGVITIKGSLDGLGVNVVNLSSWKDGTYHIATAENQIISGINIHDAMLGGQVLSQRQDVKFEIKQAHESASGYDELWLTMSSGASMELIWAGTGTANDWNTKDTNTNWNDGSGATNFVNKDSVVFDGTAAEQNVVVDGGGTQVSGMVVSGGDHVFTGGNIVGKTDVTGNNITGTGRLDVTGGDTTFKNSVDFDNGVAITGGSVTVYDDGGSNRGSLNDMAVSNGGDLIFDIAANVEHGHAGVISGNGRVFKESEGTLILTANNTGTGLFTQNDGTVELTYGWGGDYTQNKGTLTTAGTNVTMGGAGTNSVFKGIINPNGADKIGTLVIDGSVQFDNTRYIVSLQGTNVSDLVDIRDASFDITGLGTVDIGLWSEGSYKILVSASNITGLNPNSVTILINGEVITNGRIQTSLDFNGTTNELWLTTVMTGGNLEVVWDKPMHNWNTSDLNWTNEQVVFAPGDYAKFMASGSDTVTIIPSGGVQVSGMEIEEGSNYVFAGNKIIGNMTVASGSTITPTGKLEVKADASNATTVVFENQVDFMNGMEIANNATVTVSNNGTNKLGTLGATAVTNNGDLIFNIETAGNVVTQSGAITGGNVTKQGAGTLVIGAAGSGNFVQAQNGGVVNLQANWTGNYTQASGGTLTGKNGVTITGNVELAGAVRPDGVMNVSGDLHLNGATLGIDASTTNKDRIDVTGDVTFAGTNHVTVYEWTDGTYVILTAAGTMDPNAESFFDQTTFNSGDRQSAVLSQNGNQLELTLSTLYNTNIIWEGKPGTGGNVWDTSVDNKWNDGAGNDMNFNHNDYVIFDETGVRKDVEVVVGGVTVDGMVVAGGDYTFDGGKITGNNTMGDPDSGKLIIEGGASGSFNNDLSFSDGIFIENGGAMIVNKENSLTGNDVTNNGSLHINGNNEIDNLTGNGGYVSFGPNSGKLTITGNLSGSQTFSPIYVNMNTGDVTNQIVVNGDITGNHRIELVGVGDINRPTADPIIIVNAPNNTASGVINANNFDYGIYQYGMRPNAGNTQWHLYRSGMSSVAQAIINTAGSLSNSWFAQSDNLFKRMGDVRMGWRLDHSGNFWAKAYATRFNVDMDIAGVSKLRENIYGIDFGADFFAYNTKNGQFTLGGFGGYANTDRKFRDGSRATGETDSIYAGFYGTWTNNDGWFVDGVVKGQYFNSEISARGDKADFKSYGLGASVEVGRKFTANNNSCNNFYIEPSLKGEYAYINMRDYRTNMGLRVKGDDAHVFRLSGIVRVGLDFELENGSIISPYLKGGFEAQTSTGGKVHMAGETFKPNMNGVRAVFGGGVAWQFDEDLQMHVDYEGAFGKKYDKIFNVTVGLRYTF